MAKDARIGEASSMREITEKERVDTDRRQALDELAAQAQKNDMGY